MQDITVTEVIFEDDVEVKASYTNQIEVLKDKPVIENYQATDNYDEEKVNFVFELQDLDNSIISAKARLIKQDGSTWKENEIVVGQNNFDFEVEENVMQMFKMEFEYTGRISEIIEIGRKVDGVKKYNVDTTLINKIILKEVGLKDENIIDSNICTVCNSDLFHSYRVDKEKSGRNGAFIGMV